jgi:hypothetical protein
MSGEPAAGENTAERMTPNRAVSRQPVFASPGGPVEEIDRGVIFTGRQEIQRAFYEAQEGSFDSFKELVKQEIAYHSTKEAKMQTVTVIVGLFREQSELIAQAGSLLYDLVKEAIPDAQERKSEEGKSEEDETWKWMEQ